MITFNYLFLTSTLRLLPLLMVLTLTACTTLKQEKRVDEPDSAMDSQALDLPKLSVSKNLLVEILSAELALKKGNYDLAVEKFYLTARQSSDPRLAAKAAYWALKNQDFAKSKAAAQLWLGLLENQPVSQLNQARIVLASSLIETSDYDQAQVILQQVIDTSPDKDIYKRISTVLSLLKNTQGMTDFYQRLIESAQDVGSANVGLAVLAARLDDFSLSRRAVDKALLADKNDEDAALLKLSYLFEDAVYDDIALFAGNYLDRNPDAAYFRMEYASYLLSHGDYDKAIAQFERAGSSKEALYQEASLNIVALAMQENNYQLADKKLAALLEDNPTDDRLSFYRCQVKRELEKFKDAAQLCSDITVGDYYFPAQLELAEILADQGNIIDAINQLNAIPVSGHAEQIRVYMTQQQIFQDAGQPEQAVSILTAALDKYLDDTLLLYTRGLLFSQMGLVKEHETDMRRLITLEPDNAHAYNALGYSLADLTTRYDEALELILKAVELRPDDAYILDSLGWVYFKMNQLDKAKLHLEHAFEIKGDAEIAAHLGELYWLMGDQARARSIWANAKKNTPDNSILNQTLKRFL